MEQEKIFETTNTGLILGFYHSISNYRVESKKA